MQQLVYLQLFLKHSTKPRIVPLTCSVKHWRRKVFEMGGWGWANLRLHIFERITRGESKGISKLLGLICFYNAIA